MDGGYCFCFGGTRTIEHSKRDYLPLRRANFSEAKGQKDLSLALVEGYWDVNVDDAAVMCEPERLKCGDKLPRRT